MQAILIAGGAGTRLRPYTLHTPKPLLALCGRPVMEYQLDLLKRAGITQVVFAVGVMADQVREYFGNGDLFGMQFRYAIEPEPLGTAGAIRNCLPLLDGETTLVFNADILTDADLAAILAAHRASGAEATLTLTPVDDPSRYGVIVLDGDRRVTAFIEKPPAGTAPSNQINAGIYVLEESVIRDIPDHRAVSIERETYPSMIATGRQVRGFSWTGYWLDIGTAESFLQAHWDLLHRRCHAALPAAEPSPGLFLGMPLPDGVQVEGPAFIDSGVRFDGPCQIGPEVCFNEGARIAPGAVLQRVVALPGARVPAGTWTNEIFGADHD